MTHSQKTLMHSTNVVCIVMQMMVLNPPPLLPSPLLTKLRKENYPSGGKLTGPYLEILIEYGEGTQSNTGHKNAILSQHSILIYPTFGRSPYSYYCASMSLIFNP